MLRKKGCRTFFNVRQPHCFFYDEPEFCLSLAAGTFEHTYRIGGDEFLAFSADKEEAVINQLLQEIKETIQREGYSIAVGIAWKNSANTIHDLVKKSEQKMYEEKRRYYAENRKEHRGKHFFMDITN